MKIQRFGTRAFTMLELMIVVGVIAVIVGIAVPSWMRARETAQRTALVNEIRNNVDAFTNYAAEQNSLPPTASFQQVPAGMQAYMPQNSTWTTSPQGGGYWCWLNLPAPATNGFSDFVAVYNSGLSQNALAEMENLLDGGNNTTGVFTTAGVDTSGDPSSGNGSWMFMGVQGYH
ncbi:MAG TPA: prepilin-type N-terminal cleavage/methylation domain-containing protein [Chthoniobacteraceae bacterium]|nr:prepilin-type N-terminal cleavage/methylation domain-containing protein [Chthoniobacteraceae bacterium]